jgi:hypothetical protein
VERDLEQRGLLAERDLERLLHRVLVAEAQPVRVEVVALEAAVVRVAELDERVRDVLADPVADRRPESDGPPAGDALEDLGLLLDVAPLALGDAGGIPLMASPTSYGA